MAESPKDQKKSISGRIKGSIGLVLGRDIGNVGCFALLVLSIFAVGALLSATASILGAGDDVVKPIRSIGNWGYSKLYPERVEAERKAREKKAEAERKAREKKAEADQIAHEKKTEAGRLGNLVAGVKLPSFRSTLGDNEPEISFPAPGHLTREIYVSKYAYVQVWVDREENVAAFSVTARTKDFHPTFTYKSREIILGQTSIARAFGPLSSAGQMALGGTCGYYYEAFKGYWSNSQTVAVGIASVGEVTDESILHSICTIKGGDVGEAAQRLGDCDIYDFDPNNYENVSCFTDSPAGKKFRQDAIINVFVITKPDGELPEEEESSPQRLAPHDHEVPDNG